MRIAEIFKSVQGEGFLTGTESVFVRVSGCNLRCWFCDTPYTSWEPEGDDRSVREVAEEIDEIDLPHVVLTGGEPMLFGELVPLCERIRAAGRHITIETAGTVYRKLDCDLMSISPKLSNSTPGTEQGGAWHVRHETARHAPHVMRRLMAEYTYQLKFVVDARADCQEVEAYLDQFPQIDRTRVMLMPQGVTAETLAATTRWLEPYCAEHGFHLCPRRQIEWFGLVRGT